MDPHGAITISAGKFKIERYNDSKILKNGRPITTATDLIHLDRLVFGASQYFVFIEPSKSKATDQVFSFEQAQDEIGKASGVMSKDTRNMTQGSFSK